MTTLNATLVRVSEESKMYKLENGERLATVTCNGSFLKRVINPIIRSMREKHADYIYIQFSDGRNFTARLSEDKHYHEFRNIRFRFVA